MKLGRYTFTLLLAVGGHAWRWPWDPLKPASEDAFYTYHDTAALRAMAPGQIMDVRPVEDIQNLRYAEAWQVRYRSTRTNGQPTFGITTIIVPLTLSTTRPGAFVTYQQYQDSSCIDCCPSYIMRYQAADVKFQPILDQGLVLNVPDHEGPNSAFGAGVLEGLLTLDSIRAALASASHFGSRLTANSKTVMHGFSGGSIPTGWAYELQKTYAPELNSTIVGAATCGFVVNLMALVRAINKTMYAGFLPPAVIGLSTEYETINDVMRTELTWSGVLAFRRQDNQCMYGNLFQYPWQDIFYKYFTSGNSILDRPDVNEMMASLNMGGAAADFPLYVYHGALDDIAPVAAVDAAIDNFCANGGNIHYQRVPGAGHVDTDTKNWATALQWLLDALDGKIHYSGCSRVDAPAGTVPLSASTPGSDITEHPNMGLLTPEQEVMVEVAKLAPPREMVQN